MSDEILGAMAWLDAHCTASTEYLPIGIMGIE
jgi:hypothetical protein